MVLPDFTRTPSNRADMLLYLSFVIIDSMSSSKAFSREEVSSSAFAFCSSLSPSRERSRLSRSRTFMAVQRLEFSAIFPVPALSSEAAVPSVFEGRSSSMAPIAFSIRSENLIAAGFAFSTAAFWAAAVTSLIPFPCRATVSITGQPSLSESFFTSILSPDFLRASTMLSAKTTGFPSSIICVVR